MTRKKPKRCKKTADTKRQQQNASQHLHFCCKVEHFNVRVCGVDALWGPASCGHQRNCSLWRADFRCLNINRLICIILTLSAAFNVSVFRILLCHSPYPQSSVLTGRRRVNKHYLRRSQLPTLFRLVFILWLVITHSLLPLFFTSAVHLRITWLHHPSAPQISLPQSSSLWFPAF